MQREPASLCSDGSTPNDSHSSPFSFSSGGPPRLHLSHVSATRAVQDSKKHDAHRSLGTPEATCRPLKVRSRSERRIEKRRHLSPSPLGCTVSTLPVTKRNKCAPSPSVFAACMQLSRGSELFSAMAQRKPVSSEMVLGVCCACSRRALHPKQA